MFFVFESGVIVDYVFTQFFLSISISVSASMNMSFAEQLSVRKKCKLNDPRISMVTSHELIVLI